jgi:NAD(P)-dependent dehydrogenase (short-subunit alcohol dehydrogenase family)
MDLELTGRKAIITGGTRGIGRRTAEVLAEEGVAVGLCARSGPEVDETVEALEARGVAAFGRALDVADAPALSNWVADAAEALGGLDVVVANVSSLGSGEGEEAWRNAFEVDLLHTVRVVDAALPFLRESDAGAIVVVSTVAAIETGPFEGPYGTLKAALIRYAAGMASALAADGIRVNTVSPGTIYIEDGFWGGISRENPEFFAQAEGWNPMGRMGTPDEVARAIAFLASPAASFITGTNLLVDGGLTRGVQF